MTSPPDLTSATVYDGYLYLNLPTVGRPSYRFSTRLQQNGVRYGKYHCGDGYGEIIVFDTSCRLNKSASKIVGHDVRGPATAYLRPMKFQVFEYWRAADFKVTNTLIPLLIGNLHWCLRPRKDETLQLECEWAGAGEHHTTLARIGFRSARI